MDERNRDRTTRKIIVLTPLQVKPFKTICQNVIKECGSQRQAAKALGVTVTVLRGVVFDDYLTDKQARIILERRKAIKQVS